jgi:DNA polymerase
MKCRPYLLRQLELLQPRVIVALGTYAAQTLLDTKVSIGKLRGQVHDYQGIPVVVTYHPAALLRNPAWKRPTWEDVQLARRILDGSVA